jgi:tetratricopeptide (TPR) repeat protein
MCKIITFLVGAILISQTPAQEDKKDIVTAKKDEPAYKVLFESGFYQEAIDYLETRLREAPDSNFQEHAKYLAFCLILTGRANEAGTVFRDILEKDPGFSLDPIRTSPKIYEVFSAARSQWASARPAAAPDTLAASDTAVAPAPVAAAAPAEPDIVPATLPPPAARPWYRIPVCLAPGGAGQFYHRQNVKGTVFAGLQAAGLGLSIWAFSQKDPDYGWTPDNENYNILFRVQFGVFAAAWAAGVIDALLFERKAVP